VAEVLQRWIGRHEHSRGREYGMLVGFEVEIREYSDRLRAAYDRLAADEQVALFGYVRKLLEEPEDVIDRWIQQHEAEAGHYAAFTGFEAELTRHSECLDDVWVHLHIYDQIELYAWVTGLLLGQRESRRKQGAGHD
jgi:hypothetical protein